MSLLPAFQTRFSGRSQPRAAKLQVALLALAVVVLLHVLENSTLSIGSWNGVGFPAAGFVTAPQRGRGSLTRNLALGARKNSEDDGYADIGASMNDFAAGSQAGMDAEPKHFEVNELVEVFKYGRWRACTVLAANEDSSYIVKIVGSSTDRRATFSHRPNKMRKIRAVSQGSLQIGKKYKGLVIGVTDFGAFVHLGGTNVGLVHSSCMRSGSCLDVFEEVEEGQYVDVWVKEVIGNKVSLSTVKEKLQPIISLDRTGFERSGIKVGDTFKGMVWELKHSFCWIRGYVQKDDGLVSVDGAMLRLSQMANPDLTDVVQQDGEVRTSSKDVADVVHVGQELDVTVLRVEPSLLHVTAMPLEDALRRDQARQESRRAQGLVA